MQLSAVFVPLGQSNIAQDLPILIIKNIYIKIKVSNHIACPNLPLRGL
jgi:hypothetical protein